MTERVSFSFGRNWERYLDEMPADALERMTSYVVDWLGNDLAGQRLIDIGSGLRYHEHHLGFDYRDLQTAFERSGLATKGMRCSPWAGGPTWANSEIHFLLECGAEVAASVGASQAPAETPAVATELPCLS